VKNLFDVDIDTTTKTDKTLYGIPAMIYNEEQERISPHPSGVYLEDVPIDTMTGLCAFDYKYGDANGFMKVDILHNSVYDIFKSKEEVSTAVGNDIDWSLLEDESVVKTLPHLAKHFDTVKKLKPRSVEDLADVLALIRPGKIHLPQDYIRDKEKVRRFLYKRPSSGIYFKKSHAISYAMMIKAYIYKKHQSMFCW
jgi:hypothetical protein